jgi:hypothetical protein
MTAKAPQFVIARSNSDEAIPIHQHKFILNMPDISIKILSRAGGSGSGAGTGIAPVVFPASFLAPVFIVYFAGPGLSWTEPLNS